MQEVKPFFHQVTCYQTFKVTFNYHYPFKQAWLNPIGLWMHPNLPSEACKKKTKKHLKTPRSMIFLGSMSDHHQRRAIGAVWRVGNPDELQVGNWVLSNLVAEHSYSFLWIDELMSIFVAQMQMAQILELLTSWTVKAGTFQTLSKHEPAPDNSSQKSRGQSNNVFQSFFTSWILKPGLVFDSLFQVSIQVIFQAF